MAKNIGKVFEENFKKSIPSDVFCYRPPDAAQSFNMSSKLRFSSHSLCDYIIFKMPLLFCFELKTVAGSSISFERSKEDKGTIHDYQINKLKECACYAGMTCGFIIDFRGSDNTYYFDIKYWDDFISGINKKSFSEKDLLKFGKYVLISKKKLKVNYRYDIDALLCKLEELENERRKNN